MEERNVCKKLVEQLKEERASDPNNRYFVRRGEILCGRELNYLYWAMIFHLSVFDLTFWRVIPL